MLHEEDLNFFFFFYKDSILDHGPEVVSTSFGQVLNLKLLHLVLNTTWYFTMCLVLLLLEGKVQRFWTDMGL